MLSRSTFFAGLLVSLCVIALVTYPKFYDSTAASSSLVRRNLSYINDIPNKWTIRDLSILSKDIYDIYSQDDGGKTPPDAITGAWDFKLWIEAEESTECIVVKHKTTGRVVVVFRGSEANLDDWLTNGKFIRVSSKFPSRPNGVGIHRGFQGVLTDKNNLKIEAPPCRTNSCTKSTKYDSVINEVKRKVVEMVGTNGEIYVTGHSLGGACAQYTATFLADAYRGMRVSMVTIGQPKIGNESYKNWAENKLPNLKMFRVVYDDDTVARLPYSWLGYDHAGHLYQIWEGDRTHAYYRQTGGGNYEGVPTSWYYKKNPFDHSTEKYVGHMNKYFWSARYWPNYFKAKPPPTSCSWWQWWC